jgi:hypothetical protein
MLNKIRQECEQQKMQYIPFGYPLKYDSKNGTWTILDQTGLQFSRDGISYLLYRVSSHMNAAQTAAFKDKAREALSYSYQEFTDLINDARFDQQYAEPFRQDQDLVASVLDNVIYGIMTKYEAVSNLELLDLVEKAGLEPTGYRLTIKELNLFFQSGKASTLEWGLDVRNGETGHVALGYHVYLKRDDYIFTFPFTAYRRHMSKVYEVPEQLQQAAESIHEVLLWDYMTETKASDFAVQLYGKEKLQPLLDKYVGKDYTLDRLVVELLTLREKRGYKVVCTNAVNTIMKEVAQHV